MNGSKPESETGRNGGTGNPPTIREFLAANPIGARKTRELCEKYGIDLDSPWPPHFHRDARGEPSIPLPNTPAPEGAKSTAKVLRFPQPFGEATRAVSNPLARCALFAAVKDRQYFKDWVLVGEIEGVKVEFKGERFNQEDHDTLLQLVKMARGNPFGGDVSVSVNEALKGLGRQTHKSQREQLFAEIERLVFGMVRLTPQGYSSYVGHLVEDASTPRDQGELDRSLRHLTFRLNAKFAGFYGDTQYTLVDYRERLKLGRNSLAKWLHFWIVGNAEQYPHKVETIRDKCGSQTKELKVFRQNLRRALDELKNAGIIAAWRIDAADLVHIERAPSPTQLDHLEKKGGKKPKK